MNRILLTSFDPFGPWSENASSLAVSRFASDYRGSAELVIRQYPVDYQLVHQRLLDDLDASLAAVVLTGQSSKASSVELESIALNVRSDTDDPAGPFCALASAAPLARQSTLPLSDFCRILNDANIPTLVSHHAGTFLCNAAYYFALGVSQSLPQTPPVAFLHFPLTPEQQPPPQPGGRPLDTSQCVRALQIFVAQLNADSA